MKSKRIDDTSLLDWRIPTTAEDIAAQRRLRERSRSSSVRDLNQLNPPPLFSYPPNRKTSEGAEPFRL
jgi:hypothetical protein